MKNISHATLYNHTTSVQPSHVYCSYRSTMTFTRGHTVVRAAAVHSRIAAVYTASHAPVWFILAADARYEVTQSVLCSSPTSHHGTFPSHVFLPQVLTSTQSILLLCSPRASQHDICPSRAFLPQNMKMWRPSTLSAGALAADRVDRGLKVL